MTTNGNTPDTIVLIHGFWVTPGAGRTGSPTTRARATASWPRRIPAFEVEVEALNADPTLIEKVTVPQIVERLESVIGGLDAPRS